MALDIKDGAGADKVIKTTETAGEHTAHHNVDEMPDFGKKNDAAATTDAGTFSFIALFKRLLEKLTAGIITSGITKPIYVELTRPADTSAYTAGDVIANATSGAVMLTFANVANSNGGSGYITKLRAKTDRSAAAERLRIHFYTVSTLAQQDNAAFATAAYTNFDKEIGHIDLPAFSTQNAQEPTVRLPYKCAAGVTALYAVVQTIDAVAVPVSGQKYHFELTVENNS